MIKNLHTMIFIISIISSYTLNAMEKDPAEEDISYLENFLKDSLEVKDETGRTLLWWASHHCNTNEQAVINYVRMGTKINTPDNLGITPLHNIAAHSSNPKMVRFFVNNDAKINAKDNNDYTPLLYTCTCNSNPSVIVEELILHGANVKQKTKDGKTVFHLILKNPKYNNELREILVKAFQVRHELEKSGFNFDELESSCSCNENKP